MANRKRDGATTLAVGYARRSTDRQEQSITDQKRAVGAWALANDWTITDWYIDDAISGASAGGRDAFLRMVKDAQRPGCPFSAVLCYDVKRFGRLDNDETGHYRHLLKAAGVEVVYVAEGFDGNDTDDLIRPVKQWQARQELKDLSKVTIRGLLSKGEGGWWLGGVPPFGYDLAYYDRAGNFLLQVRFMPDWSKEIYGEDGKLQRTLSKGNRLMASKEDRARLAVSAPERVEAVQKIFAWYVRSGLGYKAIAARLNARHIPSPRLGRKADPGKWSMTSIREIIGNPTYTGDMTWNRRSMAKFHRIESGRAVAKADGPTRAVEDNDEDDWVVSEGSHPAIIKRDLFGRAQACRKGRRERCARTYRRGRGATSDYLLTGVIECAHCGHSWQGYTQHKGRKRKDGSSVKTKYYGCTGYITKGTSVCSRCIIRKDVIEGMLVEEIGRNLRQFLGREDGRELLRSLLDQVLETESEDVEQELQGLRGAKGEVQRKITNILDNITAENRDLADGRIRELKRDLKDIEPRLEVLEASAAGKVDPEDLTDAMLGYMGEFQQVACEGTIEEKRSFIRAFTGKVELDPETGKGRAELFYLPKETALAGDPENAASSFEVVAGACCGMIHNVLAAWLVRRCGLPTKGRRTAQGS